MSIDRGIDKEDVVRIYNGILLSHKKNEIMSFAATRMELEITILSEVSQKERKRSRLEEIRRARGRWGTCLSPSGPLKV